MITKLINLIRRFARNSDQTTRTVKGIRADLSKHSKQISEDLSGVGDRLSRELALCTSSSDLVVSNIKHLDYSISRRLDDLIGISRYESGRLDEAINAIHMLDKRLAERDLERGAVESRMARLLELQYRKLGQILTSTGGAINTSLSDLKADIAISGMPEFSDLITDYLRHDAIRIRGSINAIREKKKLDVIVFSRRPEYFCAEDLVDSPDSLVKSVTFVSDENELGSLNRDFDVAIVCTHISMEHKAGVIVRALNLAPLIVAWTWDNHHSEYQNLCFDPMSDIIIPAHAYCSDMMRTPHAALAESVPLCCSQWSRAMTARMIEETISVPRSNRLYGGFVLWGSPRDGLLVSAKEQIPDNALTLYDSSSRVNKQSYFALSPTERFLDWLSYKVSLALPLTNDLSMRVFDALMAGQIPIVPEACYDLDNVIPPRIQRELPVLRLKEMSVASIKETWQEAIRLYDERGIDGVYKRHGFTRDHHHISVRLSKIAEYLMRVGRAGCPLSIKIDHHGIGLNVGRVPPRRERKRLAQTSPSRQHSQAKARSLEAEGPSDTSATSRSRRRSGA